MILTLPPAHASSPIDEVSDVAPLPNRLWRFCKEYVLGTRLEVLVNARSHSIAEFAAYVARSEIERLNRILNHRRSDSEISELLRVRCATISPELFSVLELSETWRNISKGAFDGRMGALLKLWSTGAEPEQWAIDHALAALRVSTVTLDRTKRRAELSPVVALSLDAIAKGYIVDAALEAARRAVPSLNGIAINVGGDIRCWGQAPESYGWHIGIQDPTVPAENGPLVDAVSLLHAAIATSGLGPRDRTADGYRSTTISPFSGRPVRRVISASVVSSHAADADAIATACMVLHPCESVAMVEKLPGVAARITEAGGQIHLSSRWPTVRLAATFSNRKGRRPGEGTIGRSVKASQDASTSVDKSKALLPPELRWPRYWELAVRYSAADPGESERFSATSLHDPYIAIWITDAGNKAITTLLLLGTDLRWVRENFIWWDTWGKRAKSEFYSRSRPTTRSGQYDMEWLGVDEDLHPVPIGKYILHFETNREHGKHTYRAIPIEIGHEQFRMSFEDLAGTGSLDIDYKPYVNPPPAGQ